MKKFIKLFATCALFVIVCLTFTACGIFGNGGGDFKNKSVTISVYNGSASSNYTLAVGKEAHIEPVLKSGYYLTGFFDSETGGTKYFDTSGDSTSVWQKDYPTTFYAQWDDVKNLGTQAWDGLYNNQYYLGMPKTLSFTASNTQFVNALQGNYDKTIEITLKLRIATQEWPLIGSPAADETQAYDIEYRDKADDNGYEVFAKKTVRTIGSNWNDFIITVTCPAKIFRGNLKMSVYIRRYQYSDSGDYYPEAYAKEVMLEVRFV